MEEFSKIIGFCLKELSDMKAWRFIAILLTIIICCYIWKAL